MSYYEAVGRKCSWIEHHKFIYMTEHPGIPTEGKVKITNDQK